MLEKLLKSGAETKVLGIVLFNDALHLREIARRAGVSPYEAKRELENLASIGLLAREPRGNQVIFHLNKACPFLKELKLLYFKTDGAGEALRKELDGVEGIKFAFIFGSFAEGRESEGSDIDLMVIGSASEEELIRRITPLQRKLGREINPIVWSKRDFEEKARGNSGFLKTIVKNDRVWLRGDEAEFIRTAKGKAD